MTTTEQNESNETIIAAFSGEEDKVSSTVQEVMLNLITNVIEKKEDEIKPLKICRICKEIKEANETFFYEKADRKSGLSSTCKVSKVLKIIRKKKIDFF